MTALVGFLVVTAVTVFAALATAGWKHRVTRDPTFEVEAVAGRQVGILSSLAGFAVTGLVFLVTQAHAVPNATGTAFTTVLAMFVVAYMGYFSSSLLFSNVSHRTDDVRFDLAAAQYAGAAITLFSVFLGWFALRPLFQAFGLTTIADLVGWMLVGAVVVGYGVLASALYRTGYASARVTLVMPLFAAIGTAVYGALVNVVAPDLRSSEATLVLTIASFTLGVPAFLAINILPIAAHRESLVPILAERWHLAIVGYAQAVLVMVGFLLLAIMGAA
jgi:hypothetical protein